MPERLLLRVCGLEVRHLGARLIHPLTDADTGLGRLGVLQLFDHVIVANVEATRLRH